MIKRIVKTYFFYKTAFLFILTIAFALGFYACKPTQRLGSDVRKENLADGNFEGYSKGGPNSAKVKVVIKDKKIIDIQVIRHNASPIGKKADKEIPQRIIAKQSTDVDAVSGATNRSHVLMNVVQNAIDKSYILKSK